MRVSTPPRLIMIGQAVCRLGDGRELALDPKDAVLLAYLAIVGPTPRSALAALLWPDAVEERARGSLRQRLFRLRRQLGFDPIDGNVVARLSQDVSVDLGGADDDQPGELIAGVSGVDAGGLAGWLDAARERRRTDRIERLADSAAGDEGAGRLAAALATAQRIVEIDPTSEHAHRRVMRLHYLRGDRAAALSAFDRCCDVLETVLGVAPEPETEALRARIDAMTLASASERPRPLPVSVMRPPRLIGRAGELAALEHAWQSFLVATVVGEAGLGKTRLLDAFVLTWPQAVRAAGRPGDAGVPFTTLARLLRAVLHQADGSDVPALLPAARQELGRVLPEWAEGRPRDGPGQRFALQGAVRSLLAGVAGLRGLVLDDLHFADAATLEMLPMLIGGGDSGATGAPLGWIFAYRPAEAGTHLRDFHDALLDMTTPARVQLVPLGEAETEQLVDSLALPGVRGAEVARFLLQRTGGNPLFMLETLKQAWTDGSLPALVAGTSQPRPQSVQQLIERRLGQLSPPALTLARVAAVAALDFSIELAEGVLAQPAMQLAAAWSELEAAQVLRNGAFAHDLVYEATLALVPREIARRTHAAVARWLVAEHGEPARIAAHWLAAGQDALAIAPLREAARLSTDRTCIAEARSLLEQAAALCVAAGRRDEEFALLMDLHRNYIVDDPGAGHERIVERLHALAGSDVERLDAAWARHNLRRFRQTTSPIAELEADVVRAETVGDERVLIALVTMLVEGYLVLDRPDEAAQTLARHQEAFGRSAERDELPDFNGQLADILGEQDRYDESLRYVMRATEGYRQAREPSEVMVMMCNQTRHLRQQGRMSAARDMFDRIDRWHAANAPNPRAWMVSRAGGCEVLRDLGRYDEALRLLDQPRDEMRLHMGRLYPAFPLAEVRLWLSLGQHHRAGQAATDMAEAVDHADTPVWLRARCALAAAQVGARIRGGGEADRPGPEEWRLLEAASALAPRQRRRSAWFECELQRAAWLEPTTGAALAESIDQVAMHHGMVGYAQQAKLCAAARRLAAGQTSAALGLARAAQHQQQHAFGPAGSAPEPVHACGGSEAERDLVIARVLLAADEADAMPTLAAARQRLLATLEQHVAAEFRDGFLGRNPVHRELVALAGQHLR